MKKLNTIVPIVACLAAINTTAATYYSQGDNDPALTTSWNTIRTGGGSNPTNFTSGDIFIIQATHEMTTGSAWSVSGAGSRLWIENGGSLTATNAITLAAATTFQIDNGGIYIHDNATAFGSSIFQGVESFSSASTVELRNSNATGPSNIAFGNLTINLINVANNVNLNGGISTINGYLSIESTNGFEFRLSTNTSYTLSINGDLLISGGTINTSNGATAGRTFAINLAGNYNQSGGTFTHTNSTAGCHLSLAFTGSNKVFSRTSGTLTATNINWSINNGASITFNNDFTLSASRSFTMNATSSMILSAGTSFSIGGTADFNHQSVTLRSTISGTASIAQITGSLSDATNVTIERYIGSVTPKRAWRLLSSCVSGTTINAGWQEGVTSGNPNSGYGTHITGGASANGFDATGNASIKIYNGTSWVTNTLTATNTGDITDHQGYMVFIRGDRSIDLGQGAGATPTNTTLRATGILRQGALSNYVSVAANNYTLVGNPYPSTIDFEAIHNDHNALVNFYAWDPSQAGNYGLGGYNYIERTGAGSYSVTPHGGSASANNNARYIPSGAAILVQGPGSVVNVSLNESHKVSNTPALTFFKNESGGTSIALNLNTANGNIIDGIRIRYGAEFSDDITTEDAPKLNNNGENISIEHNGQHFIVEKRKELSQPDTFVIRLSGMKAATYQLTIFPENFIGQLALQDTYLNTTTFINTASSSTISFVVNANTASSGTRFRMILFPNVILEFKFISIRGTTIPGANKLEWEVNDAGAVVTFELQRSLDGKDFTRISNVKPQGRYYYYQDSFPLIGGNYYRIKTHERNGSITTSAVIRLAAAHTSGLDIYPNPSSSHSIALRIRGVPRGNYRLMVTNTAGQVMFTKNIYIYEMAVTEFIPVAGLAKGSYHVSLTGPTIRLSRHLTL